MEHARSPRCWTVANGPMIRAVIVSGVALFLASCNSSGTSETEPIRPVKAVTAVTRPVSESLTLSGQIRAEEEINIAFRMDGQMIERRANVGAWLRPVRS